MPTDTARRLRREKNRSHRRCLEASSHVWSSRDTGPSGRSSEQVLAPRQPNRQEGNFRELARPATTTLGPPAALGLQLDFTTKLAGSLPTRDRAIPRDWGTGSRHSPWLGSRRPSLCGTPREQSTGPRPPLLLDERRHTGAHGQETESPKWGLQSRNLNKSKSSQTPQEPGMGCPRRTRHKAYATSLRE